MKTYWVQFSSGDSRTGTGLTPTFVIFQTSGGSLISAPSIAEVGASTGMYSFTYGPTAPMPELFTAPKQNHNRPEKSTRLENM